jgi:plasmid stabilization system protein ParE
VSLAVEFHPAAQTDFYDAIDWYENELPGLGGAFAGAVQDAISLAADSPHIGSPTETDIRRVFVRAFPYTVLYAVESTRLSPARLLAAPPLIARPAAA